MTSHYDIILLRQHIQYAITLLCDSITYYFKSLSVIHYLSNMCLDYHSCMNYIYIYIYIYICALNKKLIIKDTYFTN